MASRWVVIRKLDRGLQSWGPFSNQAEAQRWIVANLAGVPGVGMVHLENPDLRPPT
jgi:hypothetical protein